MTETLYMRDYFWAETQKETIGASLSKLLNGWGLACPDLSVLSVPEKKKAGFVLETMMSAYGLSIPPVVIAGIKQSFYPDLDDELKQHLTDNHNSLAVVVNGPDLYTAKKYAPVMLGEPFGISNLSPLQVQVIDNGLYQVAMYTDVVNWQQNIVFPLPPSHAVKFFNMEDSSFLGKDYIDACVATDKGGFVLVDAGYDCEQGCSFCSYSQGEIKPDGQKVNNLKQVLEHLAVTTGKITACFSAGSKQSADRGIVKVFGPMLDIVDQLKTQYPQLKVAIELELMPWQTTADQEVLSLIKKYYQKGYVQAINLNPETTIGSQRDYFMQTGEFSKANVPVVGNNGVNRGYLETFQLLKHYFPQLHLAGLILYGLKLPNEPWSYHSQDCLETVSVFAQYGVKICLQPLKLSGGTTLAHYPVLDPFWLTGTVLHAGKIHMQHGFHQEQRVGCVNGCDACDSSRTSYSLLNAYQKKGQNELYKLLSPWQGWLGKYL